jgi:PhoPQ-activated pathogenicity-related protein
MTAIIDPINYVDRYTMPTLVIDSTGDEFFMVRMRCAHLTAQPDDNWYWWNWTFPGDRHLLMVHVRRALAVNLL